MEGAALLSGGRIAAGVRMKNQQNKKKKEYHTLSCFTVDWKPDWRMNE